MIGALVRREIRAHLRLAVALAVLGVLASWGDLFLRQAVDRHGVFGNLFFGMQADAADHPLLRGSLLWGLFGLALLGGAGFGVFSVFSEARGGLEPTLFHLPVPRRTILSAKFLGGSAILLGALLPPFFARVLYTAAAPRGPFAWEMAYPGLSQIAVVLPALAAGLWLGLGRGRERFLGVCAVLVAVVGGFAYATLGVPPWAEAGLLAATLVLLAGASVAFDRREI